MRTIREAFSTYIHQCFTIWYRSVLNYANTSFAVNPIHLHSSVFGPMSSYISERAGSIYDLYLKCLSFGLPLPFNTPDYCVFRSEDKEEYINRRDILTRNLNKRQKDHEQMPITTEVRNMFKDSSLQRQSVELTLLATVILNYHHYTSSLLMLEKIDSSMLERSSIPSITTNVLMRETHGSLIWTVVKKRLRSQYLKSRHSRIGQIQLRSQVQLLMKSYLFITISKST